LASKLGYSPGVTWRDVALAWEEFEGIEEVVIKMTVQSTLTRGMADLLVTAVATRDAAPNGEVPPSVSASATCLGSNLLSLEGVLFQLLYVLDFQHAAAEYRKEE
jgi:hypothetical protein